MAYFENYTSFQTLHEDEALQIALSESLQCYREENSKENEDLAMAIRLSLMNAAQDDSFCSDTDSDPAVVRWAPDGEDAKTWGLENTLIRESDLDGGYRSGGESPLLAEKGRMEEDEEEVKEDWKKGNRDLEVWEEVREMSRQQSCHSTHGQLPPNMPAAEHTNDIDEELFRLGYPLKTRTFKIPDLGIFKIKEDFKSMVSLQMIQRMLLQTSSEMRIPSDKGILTPFNPNIPKQNVFNTPESTTYKESQSKQISGKHLKDTTARRLHQIPDKTLPKQRQPFQLEKEQQRRARLYDNLVHAQRRYAEKISAPCGPSGHYTKEEWNSLGEGLDMEDWEGAFLSEIPMARKENDGDDATNFGLVDQY